MELMNCDDDQTLLIKALIKARSSMTAVFKNKTNEFFGKGRKGSGAYADLASYIDASIDALTENELFLTHLLDAQGDKTYIITKVMHSSGQSLSSKMPISDKPIAPQDYGKLITYYKRYMYSAIFNLASEDDDGEAGQKPYREEEKKNRLKDSILQGEAERSYEIEYVNEEETINLSQAYENLEQERKVNCMKYIRDKFNTDTFNKIPKSNYKKLLAMLKVNNDNSIK